MIVHYITGDLDTYVGEFETPDGNLGWRASCPQIPGCVFVHRDQAFAVKMVRTAVMAMSSDDERADLCQ